METSNLENGAGAESRTWVADVPGRCSTVKLIQQKWWVIEDLNFKGEQFHWQYHLSNYFCLQSILYKRLVNLQTFHCSLSVWPMKNGALSGIWTHIIRLRILYPIPLDEKGEWLIF